MKKLYVFFLLFALPFSYSLTLDTITATTPIRDGDSLVSDGGVFELGFFSPGMSNNRYVAIWFKNIKNQSVVWVANRTKPLKDRTGILTISDNRSLVLQDQFARVYWSSGSSTASNPIGQLLDSGNLVLKATSETESYDWQSFDYPSDTMLPGMKLGWTTNPYFFDRYLTTWKSSDDPSLGDYTFRIDPHWPSQLLIMHLNTTTCRNGPYTGLEYSGVPNPMPNDIVSFNIISKQDESYYTYDVKNRSVVTRLVLRQSVIQREVWFHETQDWRPYWWMPMSQCDIYATCGPYGVCNSDASPVCQCLQGFQPKSFKDWNLSYTSAGCVRRVRLDCNKGDDGFLNMSRMKLPDAWSATMNESMSLEECREWCLKDCACTAYASASVIGEGSGCIAWHGDLLDLRQMAFDGQDLFVRVAASELDLTTSSLKRSNRVAVIVIVTVTFGMFLLGTICCCILKRAKNRGYRAQQPTIVTTPFEEIWSEEYNGGKEFELPLIDLGTIESATANFSLANKLGEGGFGPVYKGKLGDGQEIAVKRLSKESLQGIDELKNEVTLIAKLQHRNLVRLLGCCIQGEERMLIYEYMLNRSLDTYIFDKSKGAQLNWRNRFIIIEGVARGLVYLHHDSMFRIIHRDLKASNILLDGEMNPKISDFGMARLFGGDQMAEKTRRVVGTYGYMSPEYAMDGIFSVKSDVFSFGVLVLEIISGKKNKGVYYSDPQLSLLSYVWGLWKEGNCLELVDESICNSYRISEVLRCIQVGLLCVQERAQDRPSMPLVVLMLCNENALLPQPKQPGFCAARFESSSGNSSNCVTLTTLEGR